MTFVIVLSGHGEPADGPGQRSLLWPLEPPGPCQLDQERASLGKALLGSLSTAQQQGRRGQGTMEILSCSASGEGTTVKQSNRIDRSTQIKDRSRPGPLHHPKGLESTVLAPGGSWCLKAVPQCGAAPFPTFPSWGGTLKSP